MSFALLVPASGMRWGRARLQRLPARCAAFMGRQAPILCSALTATSSTASDCCVDLADEIDEDPPEQKKPNPEYDEEYLKFLDLMSQKMPEYPPDFPPHFRDQDLSPVINAILHKARDNPAFQHEWDYYPNIMTPRSARDDKPGPQQLMWQRLSQRNPFFQVCLQQIGALMDHYRAMPSGYCNMARHAALALLTAAKKFLWGSVQTIFNGLQEDL